VENKDHIKDLFKDRFTEFEEKVDPGVWNNIQSRITPTTSASITVGSTSVVTKLLVAAITIGAISTISYFVLNEEPINNEKHTTEEIIEPYEKTEIKKETSNTKIEKEELIVTPVEEVKTSPSIGKNEAVLSSKKPNSVALKPIGKTERKQEIEKEVSQKEEDTTQKDIVSKAPKSIIIAEQSRVVASPMGGVAPLEVSFESLANVKAIKWKFNDGEESSEVSPSHVYEKPGIYFVTMLAQLEDGTNVMDKAVIEVKEAPVNESVNTNSSKLSVPNIFTPNNDGENDAFFVTCNEIESFTMSIYSVNGDLVFSTENPEDKWTGIDLRGNYLEDGVYYYLINAIGSDLKVYAPKGYITLRKGN
jgi:gliding motility-associated-like protein